MRTGMISIEALKNVKHLVCHKNPGSPCPDGTASMLILNSALLMLGVKARRLNFVSHDLLAELPAEPDMLFCDIAPRAGRAREFLEAKAIVLDHHKTDAAVVRQFVEAGLGAFGDEEKEPGVSGAVLAFREVWMPAWHHARAEAFRHSLTTSPTIDGAADIEAFAKLAGIRDTWQNKHDGWAMACAQAEALRFWPFEVLVQQPLHRLDQYLDIGSVLVAKNYERDTLLMKNGVFFEVPRYSTRDGGINIPLRFFIVANSVETSDVAERIGAEAHLVVGFVYRYGKDRPVIQLSLRSRGDFDCSALAEAHGGGGHKSAAGCTIPITTSDVQPFEYIRKLVEDHVR